MTKTKQPSKPTNPRQELVYIGIRETVKGKLVDFWRYVNRDGTAGDSASWKKLKGHTPGSVWSVEYKEGDRGTVFPGTLHYEREWPDRKQALEWQTEHEAQRAERDYKSGIKRALAEQDELEKLLQRLEHAARTLTRVERTALATHVVMRLTKLSFE